MGNCCSEAYYNKHKPQVFEMHMVEFSKTYKSLKFPENLAFTHDPGLFRMVNNANRQLVMLKRLDFYSETDLTKFLKRLDKIMHLEHDSLLKIYHYAVEKNQLKDFTVCFTLNIVLESFEHTLQDELLFRTKSNQTFTEKEIRTYLNCLVDLLEFLQLKNISPESLKPSKIYVSSNKQPKLLFIGDTSESISLDNYPQNLSSTHVSSNCINQSTLPDKTTNGSPSPFNPFKSNILALGLIILDMMSVNNIGLLSNPNKSIREQYKVLEANQSFGTSLLSLVKTIIKSDEQVRPDPLEFKKIMLMEEFIDTAESRRSRKKVKATNIEEPNSTDILDSSRLDEKIEAPFRIHLESCDITGLNLLEGMGAEYATKRGDELDTPKIKLEDLTPTKADTDGVNTGRDGSSKKHEAIEDILRTLDDADEQTDNNIEIEISNLNDLLDLDNKKTTNLKKLSIGLQGIVFHKEIISKLGEIIGRQSSLSEIILEFPQAEIDEEGLETIYTGINKQNNLTICYLDFRKVRMTDKSIKILGECLVTKTHLVDLTINISDSTISEQDCQEISQWFRKLENLKSLALNLGGNKIGNAGAELFGKELVHMKELEIITIFLYENDIKGNEGITALFKSLRKLNKLKKININLVDNYLEDYDVKIIRNFTKHSQVEEISISLNDNCLSEEFVAGLEKEFANKQNVNIKV